MKNKKIVFAYSGGLDTSIITTWLAENDFEVICLLVDIGQKVEDIAELKQKALNCGTSKSIVLDLKEEFVQNYVFEVMKWNAKYEGEYLLGTSVARPLIAKAQVEIAKQENAQWLSHGATGKGNDQVRFEMAYYALKPDVKIYAPWKDPKFLAEFPGRKEMIEYATKHNIPIKATKDN